MGRDRRRMAAAAPEISATASPFMRRATSSAAFMVSLTCPSMSWPKSSSVSSRVRWSPPVTRTSAVRTSMAIAGLSAEIEKIGQQARPGAGEHRLGVELHAPEGELAVAHAHQGTVVRPGQRLQLRRQGALLDLLAVVAGGRERDGANGAETQVGYEYGGGMGVLWTW